MQLKFRHLLSLFFIGIVMLGSSTVHCEDWKNWICGKYSVREFKLFKEQKDFDNAKISRSSLQHVGQFKCCGCCDALLVPNGNGQLCLKSISSGSWVLTNYNKNIHQVVGETSNTCCPN
ncbi:uncharacterized protein LOC116347759 [Contarinia nasturtii]|uniref:uncharacterized protein LOC116347759 n=1 Tax=Contarinia nasturtii TaxID=265458 RepID=UPI0012D47137|nr:uncharacterized protein LOC116347759 [Contarinia nasturtii]